ncbi:protein of unknown function [Cupriavidus taiwanensis]|nr:protein of unknown function [Cupriavidus taiwanensis]
MTPIPKSSCALSGHFGYGCRHVVPEAHLSVASCPRATTLSMTRMRGSETGRTNGRTLRKGVHDKPRGRATESAGTAGNSAGGVAGRRLSSARWRSRAGPAA